MSDNVYNILTEAQAILKSADIDSHQLDAEILLFHILNINKLDLLTGCYKKANKEQIREYFELVKERSKYKPVSKIIGIKEFYSHDFIVSKDVLDPRPESELIIDMLKFNFEANQEFKILDLATGSGCLALTASLHFPNAQITASDISSKASKIFNQNLKKHELEDRVTFIKSDLFENIQDKFNVIISNPPYIKSADIDRLQPDVKKYDPKIALDGGANGLNFYKNIAAKANNFLLSDGIIILEIGEGQEESICNIFSAKHFKPLNSLKDLQGIVRTLCLRKNCIKE